MQATAASRRPTPFRTSLSLIAVAVALMIWRQPAYLTAPSFFAEEGNVYFVNAWMDPWPRALLQAPSGYFLLFTNVAALLAAHLVPLREAPRVTTLLALAVQILPVALIAFAEAPEWRAVRYRAIGIAILLLASLSGAIWLNTINSQCYFAVSVALILLEPGEISPARSRLYAALLALAATSGPVAAALAPLFVLKALLLRQRALWGQAAAICAGLAVQLGTVLATRGGEYVSWRGSGLTFASASVLLWMRNGILPLFGPAAATGFAHAIVAWLNDDLASGRALATGIALDAAALAALAWLCRPLGARERIALGGGFALVASVVVVLASGPQRSYLGDATYSTRYFYAPGVLLLLLLLANARALPRHSLSPRGLLCTALLALALVLGAARYRASARWDPTWPVWRDQVDAWQRTPSHSLLIWPAGWQIMFLPRREPPVSH